MRAIGHAVLSGTKTCVEVYNGDLGIVPAIHPETSEMVIAFDGRPVTYGFGELDEVVLAYATTIHKS